MGAAEAGGGEGAAPGRQLLSLGSKRAGGREVAAAAAAAAGKGLRAWALVQTKPKATAWQGSSAGPPGCSGCFWSWLSYATPSAASRLAVG